MIIYMDKLTFDQINDWAELRQDPIKNQQTHSVVEHLGRKYSVESFHIQYSFKDQRDLFLATLKKAYEFVYHHFFTRGVNSEETAGSIREDLWSSFRGFREIHYYTEMIQNDLDCCQSLVTSPSLSLAYLTKNSSLYECDCDLRRTSSHKRSQNEKQLIDKLTKQFPLPHTEPLTLCSIGSAGCFEELVIHAQLVKLGYKVNWILVDPIYYEQNQPNEHRIICDFKKFAKMISPDIEVQVQRDGIETIDSFKTTGTSPNAFLMLDSDLEGEWYQDHSEQSDPKPLARVLVERIREHAKTAPTILAYLSQKESFVN